MLISRPNTAYNRRFKAYNLKSRTLKVLSKFQMVYSMLFDANNAIKRVWKVSGPLV